MQDVIVVVKISPNYDNSKLANPTIENCIDVFEDRLFGWHLNWASFLNKEEHAGFAMLQLAFSYFETIMIYEKGENSERQSRKFFKESLVNIFPELLKYDRKIIKQVGDLMYEDARCGFYHSGMAKKRIILQDGEQAVGIVVKDNDVKCIIIDRYKFVNTIEHHASNYISQLRDTDPAYNKVRDNFKKGWNIFHQ